MKAPAEEIEFQREIGREGKAPMSARRAALYLFIYVSVLTFHFGCEQYLALYGIAPNIILLSLIFAGIMEGPVTGQILGFFFGLGWDVVSVDLFGSNAFLLTCIGYGAGWLHKRWDESKISAQIVLALSASVLFWVGKWMLYRLFAQENTGFFNYIQLAQPVYNMAVAPLVFWVGRKVLAAAE